MGATPWVNGKVGASRAGTADGGAGRAFDLIHSDRSTGRQPFRGTVCSPKRLWRVSAELLPCLVKRRDGCTCRAASTFLSRVQGPAPLTRRSPALRIATAKRAAADWSCVAAD